MAVNPQGIVQKTEGFITLGQHIRMPQDSEFVPDSNNRDADSDPVPSPKAEKPKGTKTKNEV